MLVGSNSRPLHVAKMSVTNLTKEQEDLEKGVGIMNEFEILLHLGFL